MSATAIRSRPIALPSSDAPITSDFARARSFTGNASATVTVLAGTKPPSPMPNSTRISSSDAIPPAAPVSAVNTDQHATENTRMVREPIRSDSQPAPSCISA
jgi:hypothetical protein